MRYFIVFILFLGLFGCCPNQGTDSDKKPSYCDKHLDLDKECCIEALNLYGIGLSSTPFDILYQNCLLRKAIQDGASVSLGVIK